ncbi:SDR family NAD(P)-dependent oxidoreductase [Bacillus velezensis]|uniref:type I polyketide synthase n=1 Tax=Bacillus velezensis TaxID=492670 RepID=UPI003F6E1982
MQIKQILSLIEEQQMSPDAGLELIRTYRKEQMEKKAEPESQAPSPTIFFKNEWVRTNNIDRPNQQAPGNMLIFDQDNRLFQHAEMMNGEHNRVILVTPDSDYRIERNRCTINPSDENHVEMLLSDLAENGFTPDVVLYLWNGEIREFTEESVNETLRRGINSLFLLSKALMRRNEPVTLLHIYWTSGLNQPFHEAVGGFMKTVNMESSKLKAKTIQIRHEHSEINPPVSKVWDAAISEIQHFQSDECEVLIDSHTRYVKGLQHIDNPEHDNGSVTYQKGGIYIITGGAGKLGLLFAEHIAKENQAVIILTGRSFLTADQKERISKLNESGSIVEYQRTDITNRTETERFIFGVKQRYGSINGIIHAAGILRDSFLVNKSLSDFTDVLNPKVYGTIWLDELTKDEDLDFFVLFSSFSAYGNAGQSDYAYANHFMDSFAVLRSQLSRNGKTLSINWPLLKDGGMSLDSNGIIQIKEKYGMTPMRTSSVLEAFLKMLRSSFTSLMPAEGERDKMIKALSIQRNTAAADQDTLTAEHDEEEEYAAKEKVNDYLIKIISGVLKIQSHKINAKDSFEKFGINSLMIMSLISKLEDTFGDLPKTIFFEYQNIEELSNFFLTSFKEKVLKAAGAAPVTRVQKKRENLSKKQHRQQKVAAAPSMVQPGEDIAIIGVSGRYPNSDTLEEFWENIAGGKNCIIEIPEERWDFRSTYSPDRMEKGKINSKWGGFISGVDQFDPLFFHISHKEAELMDPQERIFLETSWHTFEDSGYTKEKLDGMKAGVFVGAMYGQYQLFGAEETARGNPIALSSFFSSIANRVSYFFNLSGPSIALDTMCSSSLTAIHLACESIKRGESEIALAGGVNVSIHPSKYLWLSQGNFVSTEGLCRSFGEGGDGYVPGEGSGAVLLKPLEKAIADQDHIYGVIKGTSVNHGGKTNGFTVPNPNAQAELIAENFKKSGISPRSVSYLEAHGTGTSLGDPIEIAGLTKAFEKFTDDKQFCAIGSVKSNIGHLESAAGIAALTKVLLQFKHQKLAPSIHSEQLNQNIRFEKTPFYVQRKEEEWRKESGASNRRAAISSFGAGGANAHVIVEEYQNHADTQTISGPFAAVLSAKNEDRLKEYARRLLQFTERETKASAADIAFTLQTCREPMEDRLAVVASDLPELKEKLRTFCTEGTIGEGVYKGNVTKDFDKVFIFHDQKMKDKFLEAMMETKDLNLLAKLWSFGADIQWRELYEEYTPQKVKLPLYPFAEESYWVPGSQSAVFPETLPQQSSLHPLLDSNESTLEQQFFKTTLREKEIWLKDHIVKNKSILPAAAFLEMACAAGTRSYRKKKVTRLKNVIFARPAMLLQESLTIYTHISVKDGSILFNMSPDEDAAVRTGFVTGELDYDHHYNDDDIENIDRQEMINRSAFVREQDECYEYFRENGFLYGRAFQPIQRLWGGGTEAVAHLLLPKEAAYALENYTLHPSLIDGALQSLFGITDGREEASVYVPFSIGEITIRKKVSAECWAYARKTGQKGQSELIYDIQLLNEHGERLAGLKDVTIRKKETFSAETQTRATADSNGKNERVKELLRQLKAGELTAEEADYALERMQD